MSKVDLEAVSKTYDKVEILKDLDISVRDGEFLVFVGPSGCGKSTALRMIAGLEELSAGTIRIGDRVVNNVAPGKRNVAMVFQSYALYPHKTVAQNIGYPLIVQGLPKAEINRQVREVAETLELTPFLDRRPAHLSGGQRQRVALGRAIIRKPDVFLFDEPLSNLDADLRVSMRAEIIRLRERIKTTMIYVTHDQTEAMTMGDRIAVFAPLRAGNDRNLMQIGTPDELYSRPANVFVARFLGTPKMNIVTAHRDGQLALVSGNAFSEGALPDTPAEFLLGARPEDIRLGEAGAPGLSGKIALVEALGYEHVVHIDTDAGTIVVRLADKTLRPVAGDAVSLRIAPDLLHVFDPISQQRLN
ncbi:hypothetical protein WH87_10435 [Devosia epidermidihirudinis]|uniref:ABC transporter domain-containing protein n=1 Tax=Devosia epidermidihirudinis TaxID=1293439 RepID=A0A0F5QBF3_9HYPH|nr:ATP-binding cassette domain-containing protein [Devosia epidermidihirudinis]KKC38031.1 hypothetical protein WH87_10435 [Devosia epidermidihirudinis]